MIGPTETDALYELNEDGFFWGSSSKYDGLLGPWSTLELGGKVFPGVNGYQDLGACPVFIEGSIRFEIDKIKEKGKAGHRLVADGYKPGPIRCEIWIWTREQYRAYRQYAFEVLMPKIKAKKQEAMSCDHPDLQPFGIHNVIMVGLSTPKAGNEPGLRIVTMELMEVYQGLTDSTKAISAPSKGKPFVGPALDPSFRFGTAANPEGMAPEYVRYQADDARDAGQDVSAPGDPGDG